MDLQKIRNMNDTDLENYLKSLTNKRIMCAKCSSKNPNYTINVQNKKKFQQKKLCNLCNDCYSDLLDYLGICDILWD